MTGEYPTQRDGERRTPHERRRGIRLRQRIEQLGKLGAAIGGIAWGAQKIDDVGNAAVNMKVAARDMQIAVVSERAAQDSMRSVQDSMRASETLMGRHLGKLDTLFVQQERQLQSLAAEVGQIRGKRTP